MAKMPFDHEKVKRLREALGLSLQAAADAAGMKSRQAWHIIETGKHSPTLDTIERVAKVLKVKTTDLIVN